MNTPISYTKFYGENGLSSVIERETSCRVFTGAGINWRRNLNTTILRSVDNTSYYADNLTDENHIEYTLFGHNGDQKEDEKRFNEPFLNKDKTKHIYVYRVKKNNKGKTEWIWYGKYEITGKHMKQHPGKDGKMRNIIIISLRKI